jgi:hypothetical protein
VASDAQLSLPAGSRVVQFYEPDYFVDPAWVPKVELTRAAHAALIRSVAPRPDDAAHTENRLSKVGEVVRPRQVTFSKLYLADRQTLVHLVVSDEGGSVAAYIECTVF